MSLAKIQTSKQTVFTSCRAPAKFAGRRRAGPLYLLPAAGRRGLLPASRSRSPAARPPGLARPPPPPPRAPTCWSPPRAGHRRQAAKDAPGRSPTPPAPRRASRASPAPGLPGLADPSLPAGAGRRVARAGASGGGCPARGPAILDAQAAGPAPRTDGRGGGEAAGGDARDRGADPPISSSPGAEAEREVPRAPPPSALPPRRLSAAGSRHDAKTAIERNRLRRAAPPRSLSPPPPERRHRLGSLPFPARGGGGGGAHARPFCRRASAGRGGAGRWRTPLGEATRSGLRAPNLRDLWRSPGAPGDGRSDHDTDAHGSGAEAEDSLRWGPAARAGCPESDRSCCVTRAARELLGNLVASRCDPCLGDLRLSLLPGGALVKERK
ncbi:atherin-like [Mastomys coucha]|uniref:atherin-like n=1 Tax=Mastomys coucha TaxID=35658 RepID=UPI0012618CF6|nr:atherin-like [Mastomys coucha]